MGVASAGWNHYGISASGVYGRSQEDSFLSDRNSDVSESYDSVLDGDILIQRGGECG